MSEWLDLMLEEITRKQRETEAAIEEQRLRSEGEKPAQQPPGSATLPQS